MSTPRLILFSLILGVLSAALPSCGDESGGVPVGEAVGVFPTGAMDLTINGRATDLPANARIEIDGDWRDNLYGGEVTLYVGAVLVPVKDESGGIIAGGLHTSLHAQSTDSKILLSGVYEGIGGLRVRLEGEVYFPTPTERRLRLSADYDMGSSPLVGNTYEIRFDDESIYPEIEHEITNSVVRYEGEEYTPGEVARYVFRQMNKFYVRNSDYDRALVTFHPDGTLEVRYHSLLTGEYEDPGYATAYIATDTNIFILDDMAAITDQAYYYAMASDITPYPLLGRQQFMLNEAGEVCQLVLNMEYTIGEGGTMTARWDKSLGNDFPQRIDRKSVV